jgi:hypothetical protein
MSPLNFLSTIFCVFTSVVYAFYIYRRGCELVGAESAVGSSVKEKKECASRRLEGVFRRPLTDEGAL